MDMEKREGESEEPWAALQVIRGSNEPPDFNIYIYIYIYNTKYFFSLIL